MTNLDSFANYTAPNQGDAWAYLQSILTYYGLGSLSDQAHQWIVNGFSDTQVVQAIRQTDAYKQNFAPIINRQKAGLPAISESDVVNLRQAYAQIDQQMGSPQGFNGTEDYDAFITADMSPTEYQDRWVKGYQAAANADPATKAALSQYYGVTDGGIAAYFLDPTKAESTLLNNFTSAQIGGAANSTGFGNLTLTQAQYLRSLGVNQSQAQQGFSQLASENQLFQSLPGENGPTITQDQQLGAEFAGNAADQAAIKQQSQQRVGEMNYGGGFMSDKQGIGGIGANH